MKNTENNERTAIALAALTAAAASLPMPGNGRATMLLASTIFGAQAIKFTGYGALIPLGIIAFCDQIFGGYGTTIWTYIAVVATYIVARTLLFEKRGYTRIAATIALCSVIFFITSNGNQWPQYWACLGPDYGSTQALRDIFLSYRSHLLSDLITSAAVFLLYETTRDVQLKGDRGRKNVIKIHTS